MRRRHAILTAVVAVAVLGACVPGANTDPEVFRPEYEAIRALGSLPVPLHSMKFAVVSWEELQSWCDNPGCVAHTRGRTIILPDFGEYRCERAAPMSDEMEAALVIHEMLHAQGMEHGPGHDLLIREAFKHYKKAGHCDRLTPTTTDEGNEP